MREPRSEGRPERIGRYLMEKRIGAGGMGCVYLARDADTDMRRAIKLLPKQAELSDAQFGRRFFREARIASEIDHPNMVSVHDFGADRGFYYLVMDYVDGPSCLQLIKQRGPLPWRDAVRIARQVAEGLRYAAERDVIHRDVTPGNIIIDRQGNACITDLGLAMHLAARDTRSGAARLGTPHYMSPEQILNSGTADHRADIYSLGATLYHMVCGEVPFAGDSFEVLTRHVRQPLPSPADRKPGLPQPLCDVIRKMMAKSPAERYQDYDALMREFDNLLEGNPVSAHQFSERHHWRHRTPAYSLPPLPSSDVLGWRIALQWLVLVVAGVAVITGALVYWLLHTE